MTKRIFNGNEIEKGKPTSPLLFLLKVKQPSGGNQTGKRRSASEKEEHKANYLKLRQEMRTQKNDCEDVTKTALTTWRKRISRGVAKAHKKIKSLQEENVQLQRKARTLTKQLQRKSKMTKTPKATTQEKCPKTPRSKANSTLRKAGMSLRTVPRII